jgi:hypothetical protein
MFPSYLAASERRYLPQQLTPLTERANRARQPVHDTPRVGRCLSR